MKIKGVKPLIALVFFTVSARNALISCKLEDESNIGKLCHVHSSDYAEAVRQVRADRFT
jgi:hypothetical protein